MVSSLSQHSTDTTSSHGSDLPVEAVFLLSQRLATMEQYIGEIRDILVGQRVEKEWYTTTELAEALGKSQYTIQERWANNGRIECVKDPTTGKWRIPGHEYRRLVGGGALMPKPKT